MNDTTEMTTKSKAGSGLQWAAAVLVGLSLFFFLTPSGTGSPPEGWGSDPQVAFAEAKSTGKNVVMGFYLPGCPPCAAMEHDVLPSKPVRKAVETSVPVLVNALAHPDWAERYQVESTPTYLVTDASGAVLARHTGYQSVDEFVAFVHSVDP